MKPHKSLSPLRGLLEGENRVPTHQAAADAGCFQPGPHTVAKLCIKNTMRERAPAPPPSQHKVSEDAIPASFR